MRKGGLFQGTASTIEREREREKLRYERKDKDATRETINKQRERKVQRERERKGGQMIRIRRAHRGTDSDMARTSHETQPETSLWPIYPPRVPLSLSRFFFFFSLLLSSLLFWCGVSDYYCAIGLLSNQPWISFLSFTFFFSKVVHQRSSVSTFDVLVCFFNCFRFVACLWLISFFLEYDELYLLFIYLLIKF